MQAYTVKRLVLVMGIVAVVVSYYLFDLGQYLSLNYIKESREHFQQLYADHSFMVIGVYFLIYVTATALALPAATVISLAGGAMFGLVVGTVVVSFASTIGASVAFIISRYLLRDWVQARFGDKLRRINKGVEEDAAFYLLSLRLVPVFPFFVINTLVALTPMRFWTYYWVSQVGMFPATLVYVNAGKELGEINSLSGLLSPGLVISFTLLGLFPLIAKKSLAWYQARRLHE